LITGVFSSRPLLCTSHPSQLHRHSGVEAINRALTA
jgi:hypothetical protein